MAVRTVPEVGTPAGRLAAVRAMISTHRLIALDDLWTAQLDAAAAGTDTSAVEDLDALQQLVDEMRDGLGTIGDSAYEVRMMLDQLGDEAVDEALDAIAESPTGPSELRSMLTSALPDYEVRSAAITACDYVRATASEETEVLSQKLAAVRAGERPTGDFRLPFKCAALLMLVGAGVAGTIGLGGAPLFVGLSVSSSCGLGALGWMESHCPRVLPTISGGRR